MAELRLYLWRDVLRDYSPGMAFAIASSADEARGMLIRSEDLCSGSDFAKPPEVHPLTEPFCAAMWGGG